MLDILNRDFSDNNIRFTVKCNGEQEQLNAIRLIEMFNTHMLSTITYVRPIGFKINNFGTQNVLYSSEDYSETAISIIRSIDSRLYKSDNTLDLGETTYVNARFKQPHISFSDLRPHLNGKGIDYQDTASDKPFINSFKESLDIEIVFAHFKDVPTIQECEDMCKKYSSGEYFLCNVSKVGGLYYKLKGDNSFEVDAGVFVNDPEALYKQTISSIKRQIEKF